MGAPRLFVERAVDSVDKIGINVWKILWINWEWAAAGEGFQGGDV
jgi:hypothetical protein